MDRYRVFLTSLFLSVMIFPLQAETEPQIRKLAGDFRFVEGPVLMPDGSVVFSDIPANRLYRWDASAGVRVYREPSQQANGNTLDAEGRLLSCEHLERRVVRAEKDGSVKVIAAQFEERPFNSPNDVVVKSDGTIWFTDPTYGAAGRTDGQPVRGVYRCDPATGAVTRVAHDFDQPNGLCFSPDETRLYVADSGKPRVVRVFDVEADGTLRGGEVFARIEHGVPDGMRTAKNGDLYVTEVRGVAVYAPDGRFLRCYPVPETPTNLCFSKDESTIYVTAGHGFYEIRR